MIIPSFQSQWPNIRGTKWASVILPRYPIPRIPGNFPKNLLVFLLGAFLEHFEVLQITGFHKCYKNGQTNTPSSLAKALGFCWTKRYFCIFSAWCISMSCGFRVANPPKNRPRSPIERMNITLTQSKSHSIPCNMAIERWSMQFFACSATDPYTWDVQSRNGK